MLNEVRSNRRLQTSDLRPQTSGLKSDGRGPASNVGRMHIQAPLGRMFTGELNSVNIIRSNQEHLWPTSIHRAF